MKKTSRRRKLKLKRQTRKNKRVNKKVSKYYQNGGRIVPITQEDLKYWIPLECKTGMDCGPNVFTFLGYSSRELGNQMGSEFTFGMDPIEILNGLTTHFKEQHCSAFVLSWNYETNSLDVNYEELNNILFPGHATLIFLARDFAEFGHFSVLYRNDDGELEILDPQIQKRYTGVESISSYFFENEFSRGYMYYQENIPRPEYFNQ